MTSRERLLTALGHEEPDRPPIDLGSLPVSGINATTYARVRDALLLNGNRIQVFDVYQMLADLDESVRQALGVDVAPVYRLVRAFSLPMDCRRPGQLADGTPCWYPEGFCPIAQADGGWHYHENNTLIARRPAACPYFELTHYPLENARTCADIDAYPLNPITPREIEFLQAQVRYWKENSDYALVGQFLGIMLEQGNFLFGQQRFMEMLALDPGLVEYFLNRVATWHIANLRVYLDAIGQDIDVIWVADDLGGQNGPLISPNMYRRLIKPSHARVYGFIRENFHGTLLMHNCGSIRAFLPDLIEIGVQAINPVQVAAAGMDAASLKRDFGQHLVFWGGSVDSQTTLPFGTTEEVVAQARERLRIFSPGGGFVFGAVHNIQEGTDPQKIIAAFRAAREWNGEQ